MFRLSAVALVLTLAVLGFAKQAAAAEELLQNEPILEDLDGMLERRVIRALVVHNKMMYFLDGATQRGITYEALQQFETHLNEKFKLKARKLHIFYIPVAHDRLLPMLAEGYGDIAAANLTITDERLETVDFTNPSAEGVKELLVTGPTAPEVGETDDLAGQTIHVRESSSYFQSLTALNADFQSRGLAPMELKAVDEVLEDSDLLEMVSAELIPMVVVDDHKARFWQDIFDNIKVRDDIVLRQGGQIAWAVRKNNPKLKSAANEFLKTIKKGTMMGNILLKRYLKENKWVRNAVSPEEVKKFRAMIDLFAEYADQYDFDWLMLIALAYQESALNHSVRSKSGAVGIMQMLPTTASDPNVGIPDIEKLEKNVHAGAKYLRFLRDRYFSDPAVDAINQTLFTFASYNAGPAKVAQLRKETAERGLDPNVWFGNVELICAKRIGRETTQYVSNIYKYYVAYKFLSEDLAAVKEAKQSVLGD